MRTPLCMILAFVVLSGAGAAHSAEPRGVLGFVARVESVEGASVTVQAITPVLVDGRTRLILAVGPTTKVIPRWADSLRIPPVRGPVASLTPGQLVTAEVLGAEAVSIIARPPEPVFGHIRRVTGNDLVIDPEDRTRDGCRVFRMDGGSTIVQTWDVDEGHLRPGSFEDLVVGKRVAVFSDDLDARVVRVIPPPAFTGRLMSVESSQLSVRSTARADAAAPAKRFFFGPGTRLFIRYAGRPAEKVLPSELTVGQTVSVYADGEAVFGIELWPQPFSALLVGLDGPRLRVSLEDKATGQQIKELVVNERTTQFFIGTVARSEPLPSGKTGYWFSFAPGGSLADLGPAQK